MQIRLIAGALVLLLGLTSAMAGEKGNFAVAGVVLGLDYNAALKKHPTAELEQQPASCYRQGVAVWDRSMRQPVLKRRDHESVLTMTFDPRSHGRRLSRIHYDRLVDPTRFDFRELLHRLTTQYGPHDRILHRRKMEPSGRIIGFEWLKPGGASLRVIVRKDHHTNPAAIRLSFLARAAAPKSPPASDTVPSDTVPSDTVQCASSH